MSQPYRVLARKYRPQTFAELIGQEAMVRTLGNAIKRDRLAHAFLLTGVRGVGKTSTARLIAKAVNCIGPDGQGGPTIDPCGQCEPCVAIAEGRHIDVIEIDAASNNGVDNVREMTDAVRYAAVSARFKMYIIDEVHMLSKPAFNALLKTLEEPPAHVKFLLATTEVDKVPVTILSRCQRFDLRRIETPVLAAHFAQIVAAEKVDAEPEALTLIARAAEGSVRDGLSILDQAIAHADLDTGGRIVADTVRGMLGLADRGAITQLFALVLDGDDAAALALLTEQRSFGADPQAILRGLLELVHMLTRRKAGGAGDDNASEEDRQRFDDWAGRLSFAVLHRLWQMTLKGYDEVGAAPDPFDAVDMAVLRLIHAASMPDPSELARRLSGPSAEPAPAAPTPALPASFGAMVDLVAAQGKHRLAQQLRDDVAVVAYAPPALDLKPLRPFDAAELKAVLRTVTGVAWSVTFSESGSAQSLREQELAADAAARDAVLATPVVAAAFAHFPDAELLGVTEQRSFAS